MIIDESIKNIVINKLDECIKNDEVPVCAIVFDKSMNVVSVGINDRQSSMCVTGHAEINAILEAEKKIGDWRLDGYQMLVSLEPCGMCKMVIDECRLDHVYYLCRREFFDENSNDSKISFLKSNLISENYIRKLLTSFFNNKR